MRALLMGAYGLACYVIFFVTFLYAIAFVGDLPVPKTINSGPPAGLLETLGVNGALLALFAVQHSVMARPGFKRWWTRVVAPPIERSTYVLLASLCLIVLFVFWKPLPQVVWSIEPGPVAMALTGLFFAGFGIVLVSTFLINHFELFGLKQVWDHFRGNAPTGQHFVTPWLYQFVRHPLYLGFILAFWATPHMTVGRLFFAVMTLAHILVAIQLEERDLTDEFGDRYRTYKRQVGMLLPKISGRSRPERVV
jgi:protein-S-isoprenylcysteine O-methyltransferase Ste14